MQWASEEMKGDRELCTAAVAQDGRALQWASEEMKGDRQVVLVAAQDGENVGLKFATEEMRNDEEVILTALQHANPILKVNIFKVASSEMQRNERVRKAAGR